MGKVFNDPATGNIYVDGDGGERVWSTEGRPVNLMPDADAIVLNDFDIAFPNFSTFVNYGYQTIFGEGDTCQTVVMIRPEERTLSAINLGALPAGANYIDVRVKLTRTVSPSNYLDDAVPALIASNREVHLPGGSCLVEATPIWRRLFEVVISGGNAVLIRRQSVGEVPQAFPSAIDFERKYYGIYRNSDRDLPESGENTWEGWGNSASSSIQLAHPATLIQAKDFGTNVGASAPSNQAKRRGRERACTMSHSYSYASTYSGRITIRPGYIQE